MKISRLSESIILGEKPCTLNCFKVVYLAVFLEEMEPAPTPSTVV